MIFQIAGGILLAVFSLNAINRIWPKREEIAWSIATLAVQGLAVFAGIVLYTAHLWFPNF